MYEIRCKVSDTKLASVLMALKGLTLGSPSVDVSDEDKAPVTKTTPAYSRGPSKKPKRRPPIIAGSKQRKGQGAITLVRNLISQRKVGDRFMAREAMNITQNSGYSKGAYSHAIKLLKKEGSVRSLGFGFYEVLKNQAA